MRDASCLMLSIPQALTLLVFEPQRLSSLSGPHQQWRTATALSNHFPM
jgi:hypothetical protein